MKILSNYKRYLIVVVLLVISFSAGRFSSPAKVETKSVESSATQENQETTKNQNVVETSKETRLPDGTIIKETTKEKNTSTQTEKNSSSASLKESSKTVENRPSYQLGVIYEPAIASLQADSYTVMVQRRLFSEIYLGASYSNRNTVGLVLSIGF